MIMEATLATPAALTAMALMIEAAVGYPQLFYRMIRHPVVWIGRLIAMLDRGLNRPEWSAMTRRGLGVLSMVLTVAATIGLAFAIDVVMPSRWYGHLAEAVLASTLLAQRSLYTHVAAVLRPLEANDLAGARQALAQIVGRDVTALDEPAIARATVESLSENMSDGIVAPALWGLAFGLPGIAAYKAINTLDSMIGHRTPRHDAFGWASARTDDVANLVPARFTAMLLAAAAGRRAVTAWSCAWRDAAAHRSPNAGWPEAAMAGALDIRLSGPRVYGTRIAAEPWLNGKARDPGASDIRRALSVYLRGCALLFLCAIGLSLVEAFL